MEKNKILFVDDEKNILSSIKRSLIALKAEWSLDFAESGKEALEKCESSKVVEIFIKNIDEIVQLKEMLMD